MITLLYFYFVRKLLPTSLKVFCTYFLLCVARLFAVVDDIFCLFQGHIENVANLKQQYGLNKAANEVIIVIEAYRTLRDRGPYPADQVVRDFQGKFSFILYDSGSKVAFVAGVRNFRFLLFFFLYNLSYSFIFCSNIHPGALQDVDGSVPFFWGTDADESLVLSDDREIVAKSCGKSFAPFPKGNAIQVHASSGMWLLEVYETGFE